MNDDFDGYGDDHGDDDSDVGSAESGDNSSSFSLPVILTYPFTSYLFIAKYLSI